MNQETCICELIKEEEGRTLNARCPTHGQALSSQGGRQISEGSTKGAQIATPLEQWTHEDVQAWFKEHPKYSVYTKNFEGFDGEELSQLTEPQCQKYAKDEKKGTAIFNAIQALKTSQASATATARQPVLKAFREFWEALQQLIIKAHQQRNNAKQSTNEADKKDNKIRRKAVHGCPRRNGPLSLPGKAKWLGLKRLASPLFVRDCYSKLWDMVKEHEFDVLITGTPGTGKTAFLAYMVYRLMRQPNRAFDFVLDVDDLFCLITSDNQLVYGDRAEDFHDQLDTEGNLYLFDARRGVPGPLPVRCKAIVTSSPDPGHFKEFKKEVVRRLYMPVWTWQEIEYCRKVCYSNVSQEECIQAYALAGGVPRLTLLHLARKDSVENLKLQLVSGIKEMSLDVVWNLAGVSNLIDTKHNDVVHRILHLTPTADHLNCVLQFASTWIFERLCEQGATRVLDQAAVFLRPDRGTAYAALSGQIFEAYAHRMLSAGGSFKVRKLQGNNCHECEETLLGLFQEMIGEIADVRAGMYGIPKARNFAVADAVILPNRLYQMTVSANHPIKGSHLKSFVDCFGTVDLYFVVPEWLFTSFTFQPYVTNQGHTFQRRPSHLDQVTQYVLCMPCAALKDTT